MSIVITWIKRILGVSLLIVVLPVALGCFLIGQAIEGLESIK
jgi:hypothetical protein